MDFELQWATYRDASDQCSLSRIWGGIHPPADDIPGRIIGEQIGIGAFEYARLYFEGRMEVLDLNAELALNTYPNPATDYVTIQLPMHAHVRDIVLIDVFGKIIDRPLTETADRKVTIDLSKLPNGTYLLRVATHQKIFVKKLIIE
jgi:hypothetical protein